MKMNGQAGGKDRQVKIDPGKISQTERDTEQIEFVHTEIIRLRPVMSRAETIPGKQ
jgi:hypothetical protein